MRLFNSDAYAVITTDDERISLDKIKDTKRLSISFKFRKSTDNKPNQNSCTIFNLSETTRNKISETGNLIEIYAGYEVLKLVSVGNIFRVSHYKHGTDWVTSIKFGDGQLDYDTRRFTKSYEKGGSLRSIFNDVAESFNLPIVNESKKIDKKNDITLPSSLTLDGLSKDVLSEISEQHDIEWSIQDGAINLIDLDSVIEETAIVINHETGLLDHPEITEQGINVRVLLNNDILPNKLIDVQPVSIQITSEKLKDARNSSANGLFKCILVDISGDNFGGGIDMKIQAVRYG